MGARLTATLCITTLLTAGCGGDDSLERDLAEAAGRRADAAPAVGAIDPCTLLTKAEAEEILGVQLLAPERHGSNCWYVRNAGNPELQLGFLPVSLDSRADFDRFMRDQVKEVNERMSKVGGTETTLEAVPGLSEPAYYAMVLFVYRGGRVLSIAGGGKDKELAAAAKALPRWN